MILPPLLFSGREKRERSIEETEYKTNEIFLEFFAPVKKNLYNFILKSMNFSEDANDIYQDTVFRALKYFKKFDRARPFKPWLFAIANNEIKKHLKKKNSFYSEKNINEICDRLTNDKGGELVKAVYIVAESLNPPERQVFFLFYDNGFSVSEISGMIGIKPGYIKVILSNARKKVRKLLEV